MSALCSSSVWFILQQNSLLESKPLQKPCTRMRQCSGNIVEAIPARNVIDAHAQDFVATGVMILHTLK